jgi:hypothetical protein
MYSSQSLIILRTILLHIYNVQVLRHSKNTKTLDPKHTWLDHMHGNIVYTKNSFHESLKTYITKFNTMN